ncbi:transposable element Tcb2 transposase [Trichonephila clavipes]|nr:transposable element Tcb2 transposase [Trichonephila clavipes]
MSSRRSLRGRKIIGMMEAGWSSRRVAREIGRSERVVMMCSDQWIRAISFTRRPGSECPGQTSRREDRHIVRNTRSNCSIGRLPGTGSTFTRAPVSSRTIRRHLAEGNFRSWCPFRLLPLTPTHQRLRLKWFHVRLSWTAAEGNQVVLSDESRFNLSNDDNRVRVWKPSGERLNPVFALQ